MTEHLRHIMFCELDEESDRKPFCATAACQAHIAAQARESLREVARPLESKDDKRPPTDALLSMFLRSNRLCGR